MSSKAAEIRDMFATIATRYDAAAGRWEIVNQDLAAMPIDAAFNVIPLPEPGSCALLSAGTALLGALARHRSRSHGR